MYTLLQDLRYGARMLAKKPGFTVVAALTLALGIGVNSAIFSVVNAVLLRSLPFKEPDQLVQIWETISATGLGTTSASNVKDWREQNEVFTHIAAYQFSNFSLQAKDSPERVTGVNVSPNFFDLLGVAPRLGRAFQEGEDIAGRNRVVVLSDRLWQRNFRADPNIVGRQTLLNGESCTVIGVAPPGFIFPGRTTELWAPLTYTADQLADRGDHAFQALGRIKPGVTLEQAQGQMQLIAWRLAEQYPAAQANRGIKLVPLQEQLVQFIRPAL